MEGLIGNGGDWISCCPQKGRKQASSPLVRLRIAYCRMVVSVQFGEVCCGVPAELNRITPEPSEQNPRWPVVPVVIGVAVTVYPSE